MEIDELREFARETAVKSKISGTVSGKTLCRQTAADMKHIRSAAGRCSGQDQGEEWLLDNRYIADREGQNVISELRNVKKLPKNAATGHGAVTDAAVALVTAAGRVDEKTLAVFLDGYQQGRAMTERELSSFIPAVKAALIGKLSRECDSPDPAVMEDIFTSLRFFDGFRWAEMLESVDRIDTLLRTDPAGIYAKMDETTRIKYRQQVSRLAEKYRISEHEAAKRAVELARETGEHVGVYLFKKPLGHSARRGGAGWYIASIVVISLLLTVFLAVELNNILIGLLLLLPIWDTVKNLFDFIAVKLTEPTRLPRLELKNGIPTDSRTLCVISILLTGQECARQAVRRLEEFCITNADAGRNLMFGLLTDLKESPTETAEGDGELIGYAAKLIEGLNQKYGERFRLFIRPRVWSEAAGKFMGWERKRGAVLELCRLVRGQRSGIVVYGGGAVEAKYIITLDSDTRLTAGAAVQLVGAALHPLNKPVIDGQSGIVKDGFGIIAPRMSVELKSAGQSDFTRIFAGQGGIDPYGGIVSDVYQDVFGCGSFTGKGLIDADVYLRCLDGRFPTDRILSHDLLEGAFIGCGYMSDLELADSTPGKVTSHFERSHRWIRGDWQNCVYLLSRLRTEDGTIQKNPLSELNKWKIFENLRRSATPVFTMASLLAGMLTGCAAMTMAAVIAALSAVSALLITSAELLFKKRPPRRIRYLSNIVSGFGGLLMQTIIKLMLLPYEAWISLSAICTALYRLIVSKRNMLQWTTAADSDGRDTGSAAGYYRKMAACPVIAVLIFLVTPYAANVAVGIVWLLTPFYAWALSKRIDRKRHIPENDRQLLLREAGEIWRYFEDTVTAADSFLPPDNVQEQPDAGIAHRTSPTNIGLCLLSALAAIDLKLTDSRRGLEMLENVLTSVERLEKWNGHLYNWYDTRTMKPLEPIYVSTVDSGNLAACLVAVKEGLLEIGDRSEEIGDVAGLAARIGILLENMKFSPLFDSKRELFYIGWDCASNRSSDSYYDLLASEARLASFLAVAKGDVPRKHWRRLSRALVGYNGFRGMASWTGTMFEYLMPNLLLPCYQDSLLYESARFCVFVQKNDRRAPVWGISESGYWELDGGLNYRYKAHGIQTLALKRGMTRDVVISPYSSFLALSVDFPAAVANLRALRDMGAEGKYGLCEAVDFTPSRTDGKGKTVRMFMSHHLGMSLVAVDNALNDGIMVKRFMSDTNMAAYSELLQEKIPADTVVLHRSRAGRDGRKTKRGDRRDEIGELSVRRDSGDSRLPACCILSNGTYSVFLSGLGHSLSRWGELEMLRFLPEQDGNHRGMDIEIVTDTDTIPLTYRKTGVEYGAELTDSHGKITARTETTAAAMTVTVPDGERGELRTVTVSTSDRSGLRGEIWVSFAPVLARSADYEAHPTFSKLSLEARVSDNTMIIRRRPRGNDGEMYLAIAADRDAVFTDEGEKMKRYTTIMDTAVCVPIELRGEGSATVKIAVCAGRSETEVKSGTVRILKSSEPRLPMCGRIRAELGLTAGQAAEAMDCLTQLVYVTPERRTRQGAGYGRDSLWSMGLSGDLPILAESVSGPEQAVDAVKRYCYLTECGFRFELALITEDGGDYLMPTGRAIGEYLRSVNREYRAAEVRFIDKNSDHAAALAALADCWRAE